MSEAFLKIIYFSIIEQNMIANLSALEKVKNLSRFEFQIWNESIFWILYILARDGISLFKLSRVLERLVFYAWQISRRFALKHKHTQNSIKITFDILKQDIRSS